MLNNFKYVTQLLIQISKLIIGSQLFYEKCIHKKIHCTNGVQNFNYVL